MVLTGARDRRPEIYDACATILLHMEEDMRVYMHDYHRYSSSMPVYTEWKLSIVNKAHCESTPGINGE